MIKYENKILFYMEDLLILSYEDDGKAYGHILEGGKIGFRQMAPMIGEYADLKVYKVNSFC